MRLFGNEMNKGRRMVVEEEWRLIPEIEIDVKCGTRRMRNDDRIVRWRLAVSPSVFPSFLQNLLHGTTSANFWSSELEIGSLIF